MIWPKVGIFRSAPRHAPIASGCPVARLLKVEGLVLSVEGLDAIDQTPVLDIKPYMKELNLGIRQTTGVGQRSDEILL